MKIYSRLQFNSLWPIFTTQQQKNVKTDSTDLYFFFYFYNHKTLWQRKWSLCVIAMVPDCCFFYFSDRKMSPYKPHKNYVYGTWNVRFYMLFLARVDATLCIWTKATRFCVYVTRTGNWSLERKFVKLSFIYRYAFSLILRENRFLFCLFVFMSYIWTVTHIIFVVIGSYIYTANMNIFGQ